jgi:hypothetical protein
MCPPLMCVCMCVYIYVCARMYIYIERRISRRNNKFVTCGTFGRSLVKLTSMYMSQIRRHQQRKTIYCWSIGQKQDVTLGRGRISNRNHNGQNLGRICLKKLHILVHIKDMDNKLKCNRKLHWWGVESLEYKM